MIGVIKKIKNGDYELLDSGIIQVLENEPIVMTLNDYSIVFSFEKNNNDNGKAIIKIDTSQSKTIKFILININETTYGTTDFVKFGELADKSTAYISFRINSLNDKKVRSLEYSIYKK